jgi:tetratricopeptide (TPR) repeat protein
LSIGFDSHLFTPEISARAYFLIFQQPMRKFLVLFLSFFPLSYCPGQGLKVLYDSTEIYWNKDWGKCVSLLEEALPLAAIDMNPSSKNYMVSLNDLGLAYLETGDYSKAKDLFVDLVDLKRNLLGVNSSEYAASLVNLAGIYRDLGDYDTAETLYLEAIENYKISLGDQHPDYATGGGFHPNAAGVFGTIRRGASPRRLLAADVHRATRQRPWRIPHRSPVGVCSAWTSL